MEVPTMNQDRLQSQAQYLYSSVQRSPATTAFVLVDHPEPLLYPLFGVFPFPLTLRLQACLLAALLLVLFLALLPSLARARRSGAIAHFHFGLTGALAALLSLAPDELSLLFDNRLKSHLLALVSELSAWSSLLLDEMASLVSAPVGLGIDVVAEVGKVAGISTPRNSAAKGKVKASGSLRRSGGKGLHAGLPQRQQAASAATGPAELSSQGSSSGSHYPGLHNTGNTCFFNSVVQSLASLPALAAHLHSVQLLAEEVDLPTPVTDALATLIADLNQPSHRRSAVTPRQLTEALAKVSLSNGLRSLVGAHQQQDAHELFVLLEGAIEDELQAVLAERDSMLDSRSWGLRAASQPSLSAYPPADPQNPFRGLTAQRTSCVTCGYTEAVRHFAFDELSLTVPRASSCSLEECLAQWCQLEVVDWICHRCSLAATLSRLQGEVARLGGLPGRETEPARTYNEAAATPFDALRNQPINGHTPIAADGTSKMSASKKKRLREARRAELRVAHALDSGEHEDELELSAALQGVKMERVMSRCSTKQVMLARLPRLLAVHLNRSTYSAGSFGASKNTCRVTFPEIIDLTPFTTDGELSTKPDQPISTPRRPSPDYMHNLVDGMGSRIETQSDNSARLLYRLAAIVVHYGGHSFGHYVSYRRRPSRARRKAGAHEYDDIGDHNDSRSAWSRISDETVEACSLVDVLAQNPFLLFYERVEQEPEGASPALVIHPIPAMANLAPAAVGARSRPPARLVHRWGPRTPSVIA